MNALLCFSLLWLFFSPGLPLECYRCGGEDCAIPGTERCAAGEACATAVAVTTLASSFMPKYRLIAKHCTEASYCMQDYVRVSTVNDGFLHGFVQCCYTDRCNDKPVSLPEPEEFTPNGFQCPGCISLNSTECDEEPVDCTGGETKCLEADLSVGADFMAEKASVLAKVCATPNTCTVPLSIGKAFSLKWTVIYSKILCTEPKGNLIVETGEAKSLHSLEGTILE